MKGSQDMEIKGLKTAVYLSLSEKRKLETLKKTKETKSHAELGMRGRVQFTKSLVHLTPSSKGFSAYAMLNASDFAT